MTLPFLKWAGGKRWLTSHFALRELSCEGTYFEPFLGGGAVFFNLQPNAAILSDTNSDLINVYRIIKSDAQKLHLALQRLQAAHSKETYYKIRSSRPDEDFSRAVKFLYLNRTCWNGLYRVNKMGNFNVPIGSKKTIVLPSDDFQSCAAALRDASLVVSDFEDVIDLSKEGDLIFCDPPYTVKHNMNGFVKYNEAIFSWDDQKRLSKTLERAVTRGVRVIVTNADHPDVCELYDFLNYESVSRASVIAAAGSFRNQVTEAMFTTGNITIPRSY